MYNLINLLGISLLLLLLIVFLVLNFNLKLRNYVFEKLYDSDYVRNWVTEASYDIRKKLFENLENNVNNLTILEIGPAAGYNFQFYPKNTNLIALDSNEFFKTEFNQSLNRFPNIKLIKYIVGSAESMDQITDQSVDVVVGTYIHCSINNRLDALHEIKRVLKKGGCYYFMEHIGYPLTSFKNAVLLSIQVILGPFYLLLFGNCRCYLKSHKLIENFGFQSVESHFEIVNKHFFMVRPNVWGRAKI